MEQKKIELYQQILNSSEEIRKEIMSSISDIILFGGQISEEDNRELGTIAKITGDTFQALIDRGVATHEVSNKKDFIALTIGEKEYLCHTSVIPSFQKKNSFVEITEKEVSAPTEAPVITQATGDSQTENIISKGVEETNSNIPEEPIQEELIKNSEYSTEANTENDIELEKTEFVVEETMTKVTETIQKQEEPVLESSTVENTIEIESKTESTEMVEHENVEVPEIVKDEVVTTNAMANISQFSRSNMFIEEKRKNFNEFIFDVHRISVMHNFGGKPEDMQVMIAPLKIQKYACTTVPILVSIYYKGRTYTKSSYDIQEDGKNLVQIDVNEYYFLCRGSFDDNGNFNSIILTTGPSANQGDKINPISKKKYGNSKRTNTNNGHIKFRYTADEGPGTIEVFPLDVGEQDFIIVAKNDEFIDYLAISPSGYNKPFLYEDGVKKEIICNWDDDTLEVELLEA